MRARHMSWACPVPDWQAAPEHAHGVLIQFSCPLAPSHGHGLSLQGILHSQEEPQPFRSLTQVLPLPQGQHPIFP